MMRDKDRTRSRRTTPGGAFVGVLVGVLGIAALLIAGCGSSVPKADAGDDFAIAIGQAPKFDGCGSSGVNLTYSWVIVGAPSDMADDVGKMLREPETSCSFSLESEMVVADAGVWEIELTVSDSTTSSTDRVEVLVQ